MVPVRKAALAIESTRVPRFDPGYGLPVPGAHGIHPWTCVHWGQGPACQMCL